MKRLLVTCVLGLGAAGLFAAEPRPTRIAVKAARLIDGISDRPLSPAVVLIENGRIVAVGPTLAVPSDARVIDLGGATLLPGLIDAHDHLTSIPENSGYNGLAVSVPREALHGAASARKTLDAGFTSVRNVFANGYSDVALRDAIQAGEIPGPRLLVSGPGLGITGGHCDTNLLPSEFLFKEAGIADGPWEARAKVREVVKYGADLIKLCASGGVLSKGDQPGTPQYTPDEMKAVAEEAHRLGRKVAAHAHGTQSIKEAILAGVDSIEHASLIDDEGVRLAKEHGTFLVDGHLQRRLHPAAGAEGRHAPRGSIEKEKLIGRLQRENFRKRRSRPAPAWPSARTPASTPTGTTRSSSPTWCSTA